MLMPEQVEIAERYYESPPKPDTDKVAELGHDEKRATVAIASRDLPEVIDEHLMFPRNESVAEGILNARSLLDIIKVFQTMEFTIKGSILADEPDDAWERKQKILRELRMMLSYVKSNTRRLAAERQKIRLYSEALVNFEGQKRDVADGQLLIDGDAIATMMDMQDHQPMMETELLNLSQRPAVFMTSVIPEIIVLTRGVPEEFQKTQTLEIIYLWKRVMEVAREDAYEISEGRNPYKDSSDLLPNSHKLLGRRRVDAMIQ